MGLGKAWVFMCDTCQKINVSYDTSQSLAIGQARKAGWKVAHRREGGSFRVECPDHALTGQSP